MDNTQNIKDLRQAKELVIKVRIDLLKNGESHVSRVLSSVRDTLENQIAELESVKK